MGLLHTKSPHDNASDKKIAKKIDRCNRAMFNDDSSLSSMSSQCEGKRKKGKNPRKGK